MRKNDLIKLLKQIPGNPEMAIWNGFVDDWQGIAKQLTTIELVKHSRTFLESVINSQNFSDGLPPITAEELDARMKREEWTLPNRFVEPQKMKEWYGSRRKKLLVLSCNLRHKTSHDRLGSMTY